MTKPSRTYRSELRTEQAAATRRRILEAAGACFAESGYGRTTQAAIAARAGVSVESVKAQGPKRDLLLAAFEQAFTGQEGRQPLAEQDQLAAAFAIENDDAFLDTGLEFMAAANRRAYALWRALTSAADSDAEIAPVLDGILARRRKDIESAVGLIQRRGLLAAGVRVRRRVAAELSFLLSPEGYQQLVAESGRSHREYLDWIRSMVRATLERMEP
ncbi:TetR/AcrR family transcriptional regulator [Microlunatus parietis]|uniref:AcrR family transcriptional regulator n=1 Tax=Microlunatus parietis TaxID=682979 RepID=A0A7Y9I5K4_9ACTN|nr:TetR/AcrR family transcriptional regulator [Microlunatus parietis]NYE70431.1 AcrR family transcriptional regulator [Microlunatus parietis]